MSSPAPPDDTAPAAARREWLPGGLLLLLLAWTWCLYAPALTGYFLFDDFPNLSPLATLNADPTLEEFTRFVLHGVSSPTGRPLSLLTFAVQSHDWPGNPGGFMGVNLLLHLLNGALLCWALLRLGLLMGFAPARAHWQALAATALWLVAPLQVTGVIYVIQRMTELSATFVILGLLIYLVGRQRAAQRPDSRSALAWMSAGLGVGVVLGTLAKENAALFPLLLLVLEGTLLAQVSRPAAWRRWAAVCLVAPCILLAAYLLLKAGALGNSYALRDFTLAERLMTEARVLLMYLYKLLLPWPSAVRLLYDDYPVSRGLLDPWTTLPSIVAVAALLAGAVRLRRRAPLAAFAVLWFFAAHALESTVIPLELVFEHRNYQASIGIWFAAAVAAPAAWAHLHRLRAVLGAAVAAYFLLLSMVTLQITTLWGQPLLMSDWWQQKLPESKRARVDHVAALIGYRLPEVAARVVEDSIERFPDHPAFYLLQIRVSCEFPDVMPLPPAAPIAQRMRVMHSEQFTALYLIDLALKFVEDSKCPGLTAPMLGEVVDAGFDNPTLQSQRRNLLMLQTRILRLEGRIVESLDRLREAIGIHPQAELVLQGAMLELDAGRADRAWEYLHIAETDPRVSWLDRWSFRETTASLRTLLETQHAEAGPARARAPGG